MGGFQRRIAREQARKAVKDLSVQQNTNQTVATLLMRIGQKDMEVLQLQQQFQAVLEVLRGANTRSGDLERLLIEWLETQWSVFKNAADAPSSYEDFYNRVRDAVYGKEAENSQEIAEALGKEVSKNVSVPERTESEESEAAPGPSADSTGQAEGS